MTTLIGTIDRINEWVGTKISWINAVLVVLICVDVFFRYLFNSSKIWIIELEWHLFGLMFLMGAAYTWKHDKHVRVDLFYEKFSDRKKSYINLFGTIFLMIPWCILAISTSLDYALNSYSFRESSPNPNGLPARYLIKFVITIAFILLLLQAVSVIAKSIAVIRNKDQKP